MQIKIQEIKCYLPPVGKVKNYFNNNELEERPILRRSEDPEEQYWEKIDYPEGRRVWGRKRREEKSRQKFDPDYFDPELEEFRRQEWDRRMNGVWFMNNGKPEYLTPLHYFYLTWWKIDSGYPDFRKNDWEYFMFMDSVINDDRCAGAIEVTKRRAGKCFSPSTLVRMYDGTTKMVKDITDGELVMGDDSNPRTVSGCTTGREKMFKIIPNKGDGYECNESHILHCVKTQTHEEINISVKDYLKLSPSKQKSLLTRRTGYELPEKNHLLDPYFIGAWLGDGSSRDIEFTNIDKEFIDYLYEYSNEIGIPLHYNGKIRYSLYKPIRIKIKGTYKGKYYEFDSKRDFMRNFGHHEKSPLISSDGKKQLKIFRQGDWEITEERNHVRDEFKRLNLLNNKHIPDEYLNDSKENRLKMLAGMIDTDGTLIKNQFYKISQSAEKYEMIKQFATLANSCGLTTTLKKYEYKFPYYTLVISGDIHSIPCKISRKIATPYNRKYNSNYCGFDVKDVGVGDYAGFEVDGNHLFLLKDGTVVHNTARSGAFIYEYVSRTTNTFGGAQSKTDDDVKDNVFSKFIVNPFKHLPDFFRPTYDTSKGLTPSSVLRFFNATKKGENSEENIDKDELESIIGYKNSKDKAYDGAKLHRYVSDEAAKLPAEHDIRERHRVVKLCAEENGEIIGKCLYTTTVEEMGGKDEKGRSMKEGGVRFKELWKESDPTKRNENGRTISWMYRFFIPAYKTMFFDKYGYPDENKAKSYWLAERKAVEHDSKALNSIIRKAPFTIEEAFRADSDTTLFNAMELNDRMDFFSYTDSKKLYAIGNFIPDPEREGHFLFRETSNGKFKIHELPPESKRNAVRNRGSLKEPMNSDRYVMGVDPYSHSKVNTGLGSNGAAYVFKRYDITDPENSYMFVAQYIHRPATVRIFYEDMRRMAHYFGAPVLYENQKQGIKEYFDELLYERFFLWLPNAKQAGIASSVPAKQQMAELLELYVEFHTKKVPFKELVEDWLDFDLDNTEKYDASMASGWTLVGNKILEGKFKKKNAPTGNIHKAFGRRHVPR